MRETFIIVIIFTSVVVVEIDGDRDGGRDGGADVRVLGRNRRRWLVGIK